MIFSLKFSSKTGALNNNENRHLNSKYNFSAGRKVVCMCSYQLHVKLLGVDKKKTTVISEHSLIPTEDRSVHSPNLTYCRWM